jgi:hypothetical protein
MTETNRFGRQWLAWGVLIGSFLSCILLSITIPLGVRAFLQNAEQSLDVTVQANQGTVGINEENGPRQAVLVGEPPQAVDGAAVLQTDTTAAALVNVIPPDGDTTLAVVQLSSNSTANLTQATAPRFRMSQQPYRLVMELQAGRMRLDLPPFGARPVEVLLITPQGEVDVRTPGRYTLEVNEDASQLTVQSGGRATATAQGEQLTLDSGQRAEIVNGVGPVGPLDPARSLIRNGDFSNGLDNWASFAWRVELPDQPKGETSVPADDRDPMLRFEREGVGHADVRVTQSINQDVSGYDSLQLSATLRVQEQSLGVCGVQGSECPLFIIVNYVDENGVSQVWQHGFFAQGVVDDNLTPGACISCAVIQRPHDRVPLGQFYFYEVDLIQELASQGFLPPRLIESVTLVASGHSFATEVSDVALVVE